MTNLRRRVIIFVFFIIFSSCLALKSVSLKQLEQQVSKYEFVIVIFHSTLSKHIEDLSKHAIDELGRVSQALTQDGNSRIRFFSVSLDQHPEAMSEYGLNDVPSIVIFRGGYPRVYQGQRSGYTLFSFFQDLMTVDPIKVIIHKQDKKQFTADEHSVKVVGYFTKDTVGLEAFKLAAKHFQGDLTFGLVQDDKMAKSFKLKTDGEICILKPGERQIHSNTLLTTREELVDWLLENKKPLWGVLSFQNIYSVWQGTKTTFVVFLKNMEEHHSKTVLSMFKTLAKQYGPTHDISFVIVDAGVYKEFAQGIGLTDEDFPTFAIFNPSKRQEHIFPRDKQQLNINNAKRWLDSFIAGKLESIDRGFYGESDAVVKVNPTNFKEIALDESKDVLVEFHAPWCSTCGAFAPHYKLVASVLSLFPTITLGAYDVQGNTVPGYNISVLPTLLYFPANNKQNPITFSGSRDKIGLVEFIVQHQSTLDEETVGQLKQLLSHLDDVDEESENENIELEEETDE